MKSNQLFVVLATILASLLSTAYGLHCYRCHSSDAGCGKEMNIRLQRWYSCDSPGTGGGENFCVKVTEKRGSENYITRDCLMVLRKHTQHRLQMPTIQRHGYCSYGRNDDPFMPHNVKIQYCFCNDWNGCNPASTFRGSVSVTLGLTLAMLTVGQYLL